jgi:endoglucanase
MTDGAARAPSVRCSHPKRRLALQALLLSGLSLTARSQGTAAAFQDGWPAWEVFRAEFLSEDGRIIDKSSLLGHTFSEAQAYGLFFSLVANDRPSFDKILRWTEDNLCNGDLTAHLPAWLWGLRKNDSWGIRDSNSAADADVWMAYALGEAGRLWNVRRYQALSELLSARILREEVVDLPGLGPTLLPASRGFAISTRRWRLNPSYTPPQLMRWFARREPSSPWRALVASSVQVIVGASPNGFVPDWTLYDTSLGFVPDTQGERHGHGAYNAIRVYLWAGLLHPDAPERRLLLKTLAPMARHVREHGRPPEAVDTQTGHALRAGPTGFSAALLPFLAASGEQAALQQQRVRLDARPIPSDAYYAQALSLFALGAMDGYYWFDTDGQLRPSWELA